MDDLTLEVAFIDNVEIDQPKMSDTRRSQIERERRAEATGSDQ
jgi:hypothetical protein